MNKANSPRLGKCLANKSKSILSPYITAGFPSLELTVPLMHQMVKAGSDIIELGIPFSDPMAEGLTIQKAMEKSLENGTTIQDVFDMVRKFREQDLDTPVILMGYMNPIEIIGVNNFAKMVQDAGVDGTIIVDLPPEECNEIYKIWQLHQLDPIMLCSPTTSDKRMKLIADNATGYVYYVSLKGVTGSEAIDVEQVQSLYAKRKSQCQDLPILVGFGIKNAVDAKNITSFADGVVIGAALIEAITQTKSPIEACYEFLEPIKQSIF